MNNSDAISLASAIVAFCAFGTSLWQGYLMRRHNRLTVKPHIEVIFRTNERDGVCISLKNGGLGPALIESIVAKTTTGEFILNEQEVFAALSKRLSSHPSEITYSLSTFIPDAHTSIPQGEEIELMRLYSPKENQHLLNAFEKNIKYVTLMVNYKCIYNCDYKIVKVC